jgi:cytochrome c-type biogenesis protein CcmH
VTAFWTVAALLCAAAVGILVVPLWRQKRQQGRWSPLGLAMAFAIVPVSVALYFQVRTWDPTVAERAAEGERLVTELAQRLEQNPDDVDGWTLLARSYMALGRYEQGRSAYQQAWMRSPSPDDALKIAYAESQILTDRGSLTAEAGRLVEEVLASQPRDPKALWYGGLVALELGREDAVRARWGRLLELNPPEEIAGLLRTQLASLGGGPPSGPGGEAPAQPAVSGPAIKLAVSLGPGRSIGQLGPSAQLFIFARAPQGGPPLAVIRQPAAAVPGEFTLSDADSMIQGRSLADYDELTVVARLSASGQPTEQPGDWYAQTVFSPKQGGSVALVIDQVVQ